MSGSNIVFEIDYSTYENRGYGNEASFKMVVGDKCLTKSIDHYYGNRVSDYMTSIYTDDLIEWAEWFLDEYMYKDILPNDDDDSDIVDEWNADHNISMIGGGTVWPNILMYHHLSLDSVCIRVGESYHKNINGAKLLSYMYSNLIIMVPEQEFVDALQNMINKHKEYLENHK